MTEQPYYLLPFDFTEISGKEVLVNELGDMIVSPKGTVQKIVDRSLPKNDLYKSLVSNFHWLRFTLKDYVKRSGSLSLGQVCISLL